MSSTVSTRTRKSPSAPSASADGSATKPKRSAPRVTTPKAVPSSSPVAASTTTTKKTKQPTSTSVKPKVPKTKDVSATSKPKRVIPPPMSPRTVNNRLTSSSGHLTYRDVRSSAEAVSRNVNRLVQISTAVAKKKEGKAEVGGREYSVSDVREMARVLSHSIRRLPVACRQSSRRNPVPLDEEERKRRCARLIEKSYAGVDELVDALGSSVNAPKLKALLRANEKTRIEAMKSPGRPDVGSQISAAFYIADPFREFVRNANLGNGITLLFPGHTFTDETRSISGAASPDEAIEAVKKELGYDPVSKIGTRENARLLADPRRVIAPLVIERGIATSPLLMSIMASYIAVNGLKTDDGRIRIDDTMKKYFGNGNTRWVFSKKDITPDSAPEDVRYSGIERLCKRQPKNPGDQVPCDGKTFSRPMSIALASMYRIAKVPDDMAKELTSELVVNLANGVKAYL